MTDKIIYPTDPKWQVGEYTTASIGAAIAPTRNHFAVTVNLEGPANDMFDAYSRFVRYDHGSWSMIEIPDYICSMALDRRDASKKPLIVLLTREGDVHFVGEDSDRKERLRGAGLVLPDSEKIGTMNRLRLIGTDYWACGSGRLVYRRSQGHWIRQDDDIRMAATDNDAPWHDLHDIASPNGVDYYVGGSFALPDGKGNRRLLYWRNPAGMWDSLTGSGFEHGVNALFVEDKDTLWLLCDKVIQSGNRSKGFVDRASQRSDIEYYAMERFGGVLYVGSTKGLFRVTDGALIEVRDIDFIALTGGWIKHLIVVDDVLWIFGIKGIIRYDGKIFEPIIMPSMGQFRARPEIG